MTTSPIRSAYLLSPRLINPGHRWAGFSTAGVVIRRANRSLPHLIWSVLITLLLWCTGAGAFTYFSEHPTANNQTQISARDAVAPTKPATTTANPAPPAQLASTALTTTLATDPTGQILPPSAMAPPYTYANNYDWGQCTWYVAGRRRVPSNWGNAVSWYFRAQGAGWSVGATPAVGAIAWTPAGALGHVALVEQISTNYNQVYISEMNFDGEDIIDHRWVSTNSFKYIY
jgi:peptidoglycan DL-endopeptidase CwlO